MRPSRISSTAAIAALACGAAAAASAQTLDQAVTRLLDNNCVVLGTAGGNDPTPGVPPVLGPNLDGICQDDNAQPDGSATGGGGALSQASDMQLGRQRSEGRLEELREDDEGAAQNVLAVADLFRVAGLGLWASGDYTRRDREVTTFEDGYESDVVGASAGVDYRFADFLVAGLAYNFSDIEADFTGGGNFDTDSHGVVAYGSLSPIAQLFLDGSIGYAWKDYSVERPVSFTEVNQNEPSTITLQHVGIASSDTDGGELSARGIVGYDHALGGVTLGPRAGVNFVHTEVDGYSESGTAVGPQLPFGRTGPTGTELVYDDRTRQSLQSVLGAALSAASSMGFGVLIPAFEFEWVHEFSDDQRRYSARFVEDLRPDPVKFRFQNERPDRDFFNLNAGVSLVLAHGVQVFAQYRTILGHEDFDSRGAAAGVRVELGGTAP